MLKKIFIILSISILFACSSAQASLNVGKTSGKKSNISLKTNQPKKAKLEQQISLIENSSELNKIYRNWAGTRYRLGGSDKRGIDCSAFMQHTFSQAYGIELPRSTAEQRNVGKKINKNELKQGDLVFFRSNRHVGVYLGNGKFMHASTSKGVIISSMSEKYWAKTYTQSRRIL